MARDRTTITVDPEIRDKLESLKPFSSMSFNDLVWDMAEQYDPSDGSAQDR